METVLATVALAFKDIRTVGLYEWLDTAVVA